MKQLTKGIKCTLLAIAVWVAGWLTGIIAGMTSAAVI